MKKDICADIVVCAGQWLVPGGMPLHAWPTDCMQDSLPCRLAVQMGASLRVTAVQASLQHSLLLRTVSRRVHQGELAVSFR